VTDVAGSPAEEYRRRRNAAQAALETLTREDRRLSNARLTVVAIAVAVLIAAVRGALSPYWLILPAGAFLAMVVRHSRVDHQMRIASRVIALYERGLARIEDRWASDGETGERFADDAHLHARDLDLFGRGSLFQLLSIARTRAGEQTLADWLKSPAARDEILARQQAISELAPKLDLRQEVAIAGTDVRGRIDPDALIAWAEGPAQLKRPALRYVAMVTTVAAAITAVLALRGDIHGLVFLGALAVQGLVAAPFRRTVARPARGRRTRARVDGAA
jgi:hypothetical protein